MLIIGLTGSIATGKSTVSSLLSQAPYSLPVIDADLLARQVVEPGTPGYKAIVSYFGPTTPDLLQPTSESLPENGHNGKGRPLDRAALGRRVFGMDEERVKDRKVLNGIVHPAVRKAMVMGVLREYLKGKWAVVLDVPLLFESGLDVFCGVALVVGVKDGEVQLQRLLARDQAQGGKMTEEEARHRVASQGDVSGKVERVKARGEGWGEVVWNDGGKEELKVEAEKAMKRIRERSPGWWETALWGLPPLAAATAAWAYYWGKTARQKYEGRVKETERAKL
ncbi:MAG: hypothetical protein MMC23_007154 [Stictis urceolatum]|nr:hypothetical protein [Stictis urceolata]